MECESPFYFSIRTFASFLLFYVVCSYGFCFQIWLAASAYQCITSVVHMLLRSSTYAYTFSFASLWKISNSIKKPHHYCVLSGVFRIGTNPSTAVGLNRDLREEPSLPARTANCKQLLSYHVLSIRASSFLVLIRPELHPLYFKLYCSQQCYVYYLVYYILSLLSCCLNYLVHSKRKSFEAWDISIRCNLMCFCRICFSLSNSVRSIP